jgi:hypothetical protein
MDKLHAATTGLQKIQESVMDGMGVDMTGTLQPTVLGEPVSRLVPLMACRTVDMYGMLLIHFQRIAFSEGDGWEPAKVDLGYFAQALSGRLP